MMKKLIKKLKKKKMTQLHIDFLRAISLYEKEHGGMGCPDDPDIINFYINKAYELDYWY